MKNPNAVALGKLGGRIGGPARARSLSPSRRTEIARKAVLTRWSKNRATRMKISQKLSKATGADAGILEHTLRLLGLCPIDRLAQGLRFSKIGKNLHAVSL